MKICLIDSGYGGTVFAKSLLDNIDNIDITLNIDEQNFPYGNKDLSWLKQHLFDLVLHSQQNLVFLACNTLSSLIFYFNLKFNKTVVDVITPTIFYLRKHEYKNLLILATANTIKMNVYEKLLEKKVTYLNAENLIYAIEKQTNIAQEINALVSLIPNKIEAILLGCTHLIAIKDQLRKVSKADIISQDEIMIDFLNNKEI